MSASGFTERGSTKPDNLFAGEFPCVQRIDIIDTTQSLPRGAVLGRITESGHYTLSVAEASDGSEIPVAILAEDISAADGDKQAVVYHSGEFNAHALTYGDGHDANTVWSISRANGNSALFLRNNQEV